VTQAPAVSNDDPNVAPILTMLRGNYPNPFNPKTTIEYSVSNPCYVSVNIHNIRGALVTKLVDTQNSPGLYHIVWDGKDIAGNEVSSGVYYVILKTQSVVSCRKILLMK
jgi:hypothetical protein